MKKVAIGCLVVLVLCGVTAAGVGYYLYGKVKSSDTFSKAKASYAQLTTTATQVAELAKIPQIEGDVEIKTPFVIPTGGTLTQSQVDKFVQVQTRVRARLGQNFELLQRKYKALADKKEATVADLPQLMAAYRDLAESWLDAKHAQVQALNEVGLSMSEYRWIRSEAYKSLNLPLVDIDFAKIAEQIKANQQPSEEIMLGGAFSGRPSPANVKLVERYRKLLEDNMPMATFGL
ncbi:MAG TPA: hypothetical protein VL484_09515 [Vicinamibacterales bacterium]|jgi:hypothetical protein|nr:hypothetical protein [Vicinamibacterales bacterium]